ncbi:MAG: sigma-54 dependent transcriptional regulator [Acidobacteriota bacterium]
MDNAARILVVDDDPSLRRVLEYNLARKGFRVTSARNAAEALERFQREPFEVVITDILMPGINGIDLLNKIKAVSPEAAVIVITAHGTIQTAIEAMKLGAFDYLTKPFADEQLQMVVLRALEKRQLLTENRYLRKAIQEKYQFSRIVGSSPAMTRLFDEIAQVAGTDSSVLVSGESGTGKELVAKALHFHSSRKYKPLVVVNCSAIPEALLESELFGYTKGAFTGAVADKKGKLEAAQGGTVFLDEVGELPLALQGKLLRAVQERQVDKIGSVHPVEVDVRIISASNRDLEKMVAEKRFREDLFYRLNIVPIRVPPLRERKDDIPLLTEHFLNRFSEKMGKPEIRIEREVFAVFGAYRWPGNVRELENLVERLVVMNRKDRIGVEDLPDLFRSGTEDLAGLEMLIPLDGISLEDVARALIVRALRTTHGNQTGAAKFLRISRNTLLYRMGKYGLRESS